MFCNTEPFYVVAEFQQRGHPVQPIRHPLPPGVGQQHHHHQQHQQHQHHQHHGGWQGQPPQGSIENNGVKAQSISNVFFSSRNG